MDERSGPLRAALSLTASGRPGPIAFLPLALMAVCLAYTLAMCATGPDLVARGMGSSVYRDFANLWGGAHLMNDGQTAILFAPPAYRRALGGLLHLPIRVGEWSYPPTMLLVGAPLAHLAVAPAFCLWTTGTIALFAATVRSLRLPPLYAVFAVATPALVWNAALGQNGALTGALLLAGLLQAERRPILGGALLGCLVIKPHLALLVPFALIAGRHWRALAAGAVAAGALIILAGLIAGWAAWRDFFAVTQPLMRNILEAPFPQGYHARAASLFVLARGLGAGVLLAYTLQAVAGGVAVLLVLRPVADWPARVMLTLALTFVATPYCYTYDLVVLGAPIALLVQRAARGVDVVAVATWLVPFVPLLVLPGLALPLAPIAIAFVALRLVREEQLTRTAPAPSAGRA